MISPCVFLNFLKKMQHCKILKLFCFLLAHFNSSLNKYLFFKFISKCQKEILKEILCVIFVFYLSLTLIAENSWHLKPLHFNFLHNILFNYLSNVFNGLVIRSFVMMPHYITKISLYVTFSLDFHPYVSEQEVNIS